MCPTHHVSLYKELLEWIENSKYNRNGIKIYVKTVPQKRHISSSLEKRENAQLQL